MRVNEITDPSLFCPKGELQYGAQLDQKGLIVRRLFSARGPRGQ